MAGIINTVVNFLTGEDDSADVQQTEELEMTPIDADSPVKFTEIKIAGPSTTVDPKAAAAQEAKEVEEATRAELANLNAEINEIRNKMDELQKIDPQTDKINDELRELESQRLELENRAQKTESSGVKYIEKKERQAKGRRRGAGAGAQKKKGPSIESIIKDSILSFRLSEIVDLREKEIKNQSHTYDSIAMLKTEDPGNSIAMIESYEPDEIEPFLKSTTFDLSNMVPSIRMYKVITEKNGEVVNVELPLDDYVPKSKIENILQSREGRGGGVGLEFIELDSQGYNPANRTQFLMKMTLTFQDVSELTKVRNTVVNTQGDRFKSYSVSFVDILNRRANIDNGGLIRDPVGGSYYDQDTDREIKLEIGWDGPQGNPLTDKYKNLTTTTYNVTIGKSTFDFEKNGSVKVNVEGIATIESFLLDKTKADILSIHEKLENRNNNNVALSRKKTELYNAQNSLSGLKGKALTNTQKKIERLREEISKELVRSVRQVKAEVLSSFFGQMAEEGSLYYYVISPDEMSNLKNIKLLSKGSNLFNGPLKKDQSLSLLSAIQKDRNTAKEMFANRTGKLDLSENTKKTIKNDKSYIQRDKTTTAEKKDKKGNVTKTYSKSIVKELSLAKAMQAIESDAKKKLEFSKGGEVVPYFYLGDIINYFSKKYAHNYSIDKGLTPQGAGKFLEKSTRIVLGNVTFSDYGNPQLLISKNMVETHKAQTYDSILEGRYKRQVTPSTEITNLGNLPISMESFNKWWNDKIIGTKMSDFTINTFLRGCVQDLLTMNLTNKILEGSKNIGINIQLKTHTMDDQTKTSNKTVNEYFSETFQKNKNYVIDFDKEDNPFKRIHSKISRFEKTISVESRKKMMPRNYILLHNSLETANFNSNYEEDKKRNIFHFFIGEETGLIKSISFKSNIPPQRDAAMRTGQATGVGEFGIVPTTFDCDLELMGNNLFFPGNFLFVAPTLPGTSLQEPLLSVLGIAGYYKIMKVNIKIQSGLYTTNLNAKWEQYAKSERQEKQLEDILTDNEDFQKLIDEKIKEQRTLGASQSKKPRSKRRPSRRGNKATKK